MTLSNHYLAGEGDVLKHLQTLGYTVSHVQSVIHEFDYTVDDLRIDCADGVRLTKLLQIFLGDNTLLDVCPPLQTRVSHDPAETAHTCNIAAAESPQH